MELRTLRAFVEVVRQGGFSPAAKVLNATQPTVSKAVKQLEDELGVPLLDRIGHRSQLTAAGEIVYRRALTLLAEREGVVAELEDLRGLRRGSLRLGLPPLGASTLFAPLFAVFRSRYPGIEIRLTEHGSKRLEEMLLEGEVELAGSLLPAKDGFDGQAVRCEPLMAVLPVSHPLAGRDRVTIADLADFPFILFEGGFALNQVLEDACARNGFSPQVAARSGQIDFIVEIAGAGLGVAFLPKTIAYQRRTPAVRLSELAEPGTEWHMAIVWRKGSYLSHAARAWLELTREVYGDGGSPSG
ncbi:DNA-binding transcriptional LysR family regulator [Xanthobacter sp. SG618]|uniref:LysR family transcriptional regulator n=1 Tax=Xanthobacter sp. SG618 TaxID=2587121 RepID=UPI00145E8F7D|nr:LysR family transcriptional regulator [Xanthobacter sp. SG618]NMN56463.1 DNA-binding transcriptional LysR family regulator [Xanthobacter sp. SG618]